MARPAAGSGAASPEDGLNSTGYLLAEVRDARAAVTVLDRCLFKVKSFKDASFELVEQAHLAMSRLEQVGAQPALGAHRVRPLCLPWQQSR